MYTNKIKNYSPEWALQKCRNICSLKEKCRFEIKKKLQDWNISENNIEVILKQLEKENFLNDSRYAHSFVNDKMKFNKWGISKITLHLKHKGISEDFIKDALSSVDKEEYKGIIKKEIEKKYNLIKDKTKKLEVKAKLYRYAASKGFSGDQSMEIINELLD